MRDAKRNTSVAYTSPNIRCACTVPFTIMSNILHIGLYQWINTDQKQLMGIVWQALGTFTCKPPIRMLIITTCCICAGLHQITRLHVVAHMADWSGCLPDQNKAGVFACILGVRGPGCDIWNNDVLVEVELIERLLSSIHCGKYSLLICCVALAIMVCKSAGAMFFEREGVVSLDSSSSKNLTRCDCLFPLHLFFEKQKQCALAKAWTHN